MISVSQVIYLNLSPTSYGSGAVHHWPTAGAH